MIVLAIVVGAAIAAALLSLPFIIAHKTVITRRQLKAMAKGLQRSERKLQSRSASQELWVEREREMYAFVVAFRSKARFLRWFYWVCVLTIPFSGWGLLMLGLWALQYSSFATTVRAATGRKPKALAQKLCAGIEQGLSAEEEQRPSGPAA